MRNIVSIVQFAQLQFIYEMLAGLSRVIKLQYTTTFTKNLAYPLV